MKRFLATLALWIAALPLAPAAPWPKICTQCTQPIAVGQTVSGELGSLDAGGTFQSPNGWRDYVDVFSFEGTAGQLIRIEVTFSDILTAILLVLTSESSSPARYLAWEARRIPSAGDHFTSPDAGPSSIQQSP